MIDRAPNDSELMRLLDRAHRSAKMAGWTVSRAKNAIRSSIGLNDLLELPSTAHPSPEDFFGAFAPDSADELTATIDRCLADGRDFHLIARTRGSKRVLAIWGLQDRDEEGMPVVYGLCQDITAQTQQETELNETRAQLQSILDEVPAVIYSKTRDGRFLFANPRFYEVVPTGGLKSVVGRHSDEVFAPEISREMLMNDQEVIRSAQTQSSFEQVPQPDGSVRYFESYKFPARDARGEITGVTGVSIDVTEKKKIQDDLDRQRALALHQSRLASIGELAAGVGHEINNPLTIVMSYLAQLEETLRNNDEPPVARQLEMIVKARKASERIRNIVQGLRTFARASAESKQDFPLVRAVGSSVNMVKEIYAKDGVVLSLQAGVESPLCHGDEGQIQQVVMNLLSNARDAVIEQARKEIAVAVDADPEKIRIRVRDSGPGIDPRHHSRIFDPFFTTKAATRGTGLGLSISQSIVKDHGGDIHYRRTPDGFSEFLVELPRRPGNGAREGAMPSAAGDPSPPTRPTALARILVADDEPDIQEILCLLLNQLGFDTEAVGNGEDALTRLRAGGIDALVTDLNMPRINGYELIRQIREEPALSSLKIFVITGGVNLNFESPHSKLARLIDGHFFKPFDQQSLKSGLFTALGL